ncbi:AAA family ATPase [Sphaerisporangium corydalis]|uniref:AAA family ATPase n=1 Tax=Sphaerisporangium corydalis TaxID=1441875 RepID=A0ABV9EJ08_9ACTN|nr:LuxR family transcriptional regulator [Sphaerisporangium corydalis]
MSSGQPVLHRDIELAAIQEAISHVYAGKPSVLVILGPRGIGKTTLLHAALARKPDIGAILMARGHSDEHDYPFGVVRQLFDPLMGGSGNGVPPATPGSLVLPGQVYENHGGGLVAPDLLQSLYRSTRSITTGSQPLIIAIDDADYADPQSAQWCSYIARRLDDLPVIMILTVDSQGRGGREIVREIAALPYARLLRPAPLCATCAGRLLEGAMGTAVDADVAAASHRLTQGNPLLLHQMAGQLLAAGVSPEKTELTRVLEIGAVSLTETVLRWLADHDPASVDLLQSLAIVAPEDGLETAAMLSGFGQLVAEKAGGTLRAAGLLAGLPAGRFAHEHIQRTILAGMDPAVRDGLHRRAASLLYRLGVPVERSARHLMSAGPTGDPWSVTVLREAAREAAAEHSWEPATRYLHRALAESGDPTTDLEVTAELGAVEMHRDLPASLRHLRTVFARVRAAPQNMLALTPFADILVTANSAEAGDIFTEAVAIASEAPTPFGPDLLLVLAAQALLWGRSAAVPGLLRRLRGSSRLLATPSAQQFVSALALVTGVRGRNLPRTLALTRRCFDGKGVAPLGAVLPLIWCDRIDEASYWSQRVVTEARSAASDTRLVLSLLVRSEVGYQLGSLSASLRDAEEAIRFSAASRAEGFHVAALANAGRALVELGDLDAAERVLRSVDPYGDWHPLVAGQIMDALGRLHVARGRPQDGLRILLECGRRLASAGITNPACVPWGTHSILAYVLFGERSAARAVAERELELARAWGAPTTVARALSAGSVAYEGTARLDMLHEAIELLRNKGARLERTRALIRLGIAQRQSGDEQKARDTLTAGLRLADDCGAVRLAALADKHLADTGARVPGARVPPVRREGAHPLTVGERRVTDLVLQGMSNLEVATTLSISKRTVDTHLARIYRKLGIHARAELAAILNALTTTLPAVPEPGTRPAPVLDLDDPMEYHAVL